MTKAEQSSPLIIKVGKIWSSSTGSVEKFDLDVPLNFDSKEIDAVSNLTAEIMLVKLKHEITVVLSDIEVTINLKCERCLKKFKTEIEIKSVERQFLAEKPEDETDLSDVFLINLRNLTVDISDMIRQEIILHFPLISVCSNTHIAKRSVPRAKASTPTSKASTTSCKGLCPKCGINRNEKKCKCKEEDFTRQKPFKNLKKIING